MQSLPPHSQQFAQLVAGLFGAGPSPNPPNGGGAPSGPGAASASAYRALGASTGLRIRFLQPEGGPVVTLAYLPDLIPPTDLRELLLKPLATSGPAIAPRLMAYQGRLPAPDVLPVNQKGRLLEGLLDGKAALHVDGFPEALLIGSGQAAPPGAGPGDEPSIWQGGGAFGPDLGANRALIRRAVRSPALRFLSVEGPGAGRSVLAAIEGKASPAIFRAIATWVPTLRTGQPASPWSQTALGLLRLPPVTVVPSAEAAAEAMRHGYVLLLSDRLPMANIGPVTIPLLLGMPTDRALMPTGRQWSATVHLLQAIIALVQDAAFVAITSYHHAMLPGPFLVRLAQGRQDQPLAIVMEIVILEWLDNGLWSVAVAVGGRRWTFFSLFIMILATLTGFQAGLISAIPAVVGISSACFLHTLPTIGLIRQIRLWRLFLVAGATFIGMFGVALTLVLLLIYLGVERRFGHRVRESPEVKGP